MCKTLTHFCVFEMFIWSLHKLFFVTYMPIRDVKARYRVISICTDLLLSRHDLKMICTVSISFIDIITYIVLTLGCSVIIKIPYFYII